MPLLILGLGVAVLGIVIWIAWGWKAIVSYLVVVGLLALFAFTLRIGGDFLRTGSRGRFRNQ